jgi:hypothetical protein
VAWNNAVAEAERWSAIDRLKGTWTEEMPTFESWYAARDQACPGIGFHAPERLDGETFRWTAPAFQMKLALPHGTVRVVLEGLSKHVPTPVWAMLSGDSPKQAIIQTTATGRVRWEWTYKMHKPEVKWLVVSVPRLKAPLDPRSLGLALLSMNVHTLSSISI